MYVCICKAISEDQIRDAKTTRRCSRREACNALGVGSECGMCVVDANKSDDTSAKSPRQHKDESRK